MKKLIAFVLTLTLILAMPVLAQAKTSPSGQVEIKVTVINVNGGTCEHGAEPDDSYTVTAVPKSGYEFTGWTIVGDYTFKSGDLKSETIKFDYTTDITVTPSFKLKDTSSSQGNPDSDGSSPHTNDNTSSAPIVVIALLTLVAAAGIIVIRNKFVTE